jgi:hypothetical protein
MVLQGVQFLLQTVVDLCQFIVVAMESIQFTTETDNLSSVIGEPLVCVLLVDDKLFVPRTLHFPLPQQLPLGFKQEVVALAGAFAVLLET